MTLVFLLGILCRVSPSDVRVALGDIPGPVWMFWVSCTTLGVMALSIGHGETRLRAVVHNDL